jgi:hypothetical protein
MTIFKPKGAMKMIQANWERLKYGWRMLPMSAFIWASIIIIALTILVWTFDRAWPLELEIALLGAILAAIFQISTGYHAKVSHFLECFSRCNKSYAELNERLRQPSPTIRACNGPAVHNGPSDAIIDYFNLCAEEYLMHKMGVIPHFVWDVWRKGIHGLALKKHIHDAWIEEKKANCDYYGFDLEKIMREHHEAHGRECKERDHCPWD